MPDEYGTKDWTELLDEWEAAMATPLPPRPRGIACGDRSPWDRTIRCELLRGHTEMHYRLLDGFDPHRWTDACHWPGDSCNPCSNLRRSA